jgi:hypothetical protein
VQATLTRIDYIVVPNWYLTVSSAGGKFPTLLEARKHAVPVAQFGQGDDGATVWHVASVWDPR